MATTQQLAALQSAFEMAKAAGHIWPAYAGCEAMAESAWGTTELYRVGNNPFGQKQSQIPIFGTITLPTWEVLQGHRVDIEAAFVKFPTLQEAFAARMNTLRRLASTYANYANALAATSGAEFVMDVSKSWSTDPNRAATVLAIYQAHGAVLQ